MRRFSALAALIAAAPLAAAAADATPARPRIERHGPYCTPVGCAGAPSAPLSAAAGFAAAALASGWLGRRRPSDPR